MLDLVKTWELGDRFRMPKLQNAAIKILWERLGGGKNYNKDWWVAPELSKAFLDQVYDPEIDTLLKRLVVEYLAWGADPKVMEKCWETGHHGLQKDVAMELKSIWSVNTFGPQGRVVTIRSMKEAADYFVKEE